MRAPIDSSSGFDRLSDESIRRCSAPLLRADRDIQMKNWKRLVVALTTLAGIGYGSYAIGHSGGLDQYGCHHDHSNGTYHCHK